MPRAAPDLSDPYGFAALAASYLEWMRVHNYSEATVLAREKLLGFLADWLELRGITRPADVTRPVLERYQRWLFHYRRPNGRPLSFASQQQRLIALRMLFQWLARRNLILSNPAADLELPRREYRLPKAILSAAEVEQVLLAVDLGKPLGVRNRAILETFYSTGMRRRELVDLKLADVDFDRKTVWVRQGKGKKDLTCSLVSR